MQCKQSFCSISKPNLILIKSTFLYRNVFLFEFKKIFTIINEFEEINVSKIIYT